MVLHVQLRSLPALGLSSRVGSTVWLTQHLSVFSCRISTRTLPDCLFRSSLASPLPRSFHSPAAVSKRYSAARCVYMASSSSSPDDVAIVSSRTTGTYSAVDSSSGATSLSSPAPSSPPAAPLPPPPSDDEDDEDGRNEEAVDADRKDDEADAAGINEEKARVRGVGLALSVVVVVVCDTVPAGVVSDTVVLLAAAEKDVTLLSIESDMASAGQRW